MDVRRERVSGASFEGRLVVDHPAHLIDVSLVGTLTGPLGDGFTTPLWPETVVRRRPSTPFVYLALLFHCPSGLLIHDSP